MRKIQSKIIDQSHNLFFLPKYEGMHVSFITRRNTIICYGFNDILKTHPMSKRFGYPNENIHSELAAIKNFSLPVSELKKYTLFNVRIDRNGQFNNSKPCKNCRRMLEYFGIKKVYFSTKKGMFDVL
jgi:deoxycytidylate deaminase